MGTYLSVIKPPFFYLTIGCLKVEILSTFEKSLTGKSTNIHFKEGFLNIEYDINISMTGPVSDIKEIQIKL